jgi:hypothetical protein
MLYVGILKSSFLYGLLNKMKHLIVGYVALMLLGVYAHASEVYLCIDENGKKVYQNTGAAKGCKKIALDGITVIPSTPVGAKKPAKSAPADFPKVDGAAQKARDSDRKQILQEELKAEEKKLAELKKEYNNGAPERRGDEKNFAKYQERTNMVKDDISRTEKNIELLNKELGGIR